MDKTNNLQYFLTDIADAIREKKGTSDLINAQNFADEIRNMPQSGEGGGESGGDMVTYVTAPTDELGITLLRQIALTSKVSTRGKTVIMTEGGLSFYAGMDIPFEYIAFSIYNNGKVYNEAGEWITFSDHIKEIETSGMTSFQYITEEEFYNTTA